MARKLEDEEIIENLEMLMNWDIIESEESWEPISDTEKPEKEEASDDKT